jgi:A/G-specific adenine glycosylase
MHASMEFGARICRARQPRCPECPVATGCPARGLDRRVPVARQAAFAGSSRAARGTIIRTLAAAPGHRLPLAALGSAGNAGAVLAPLARDGLVHVAGVEVRLGGDPGGAPTTIEP